MSLRKAINDKCKDEAIAQAVERLDQWKHDILRGRLSEQD